MSSNEIFNKIVSKLGLGTIHGLPQRVMGGYMHKMYRLETSTGKYAIKMLNPAIMERSGVFRNFQRAETLEQVLYENKIPVVMAMEIKGHKMQCIENQYFYVFPWIDGKILGWNEITKSHCEIIAELLAKIHRIEMLDKFSCNVGEAPFRNDILIDWDGYIVKARAEYSEVAEELANCREVLYSAQREFNTSLKKLPPITSICNGDMDSKNIMWTGDKPLIIDLECLDYGNPIWEMFQLALSWSGIVLCQIDFELLNAFITSYIQAYGNIGIDWDVLYGSGFAWLEWLEYNVKRALMIECNDEEERKMGVKEVHETIARIVYYHSIKEELLFYVCLLY